MRVWSVAEKASNGGCPSNADGRHAFNASDGDLDGPLYPCACGKKAPPNDPNQGVVQHEAGHLISRGGQ